MEIATVYNANEIVPCGINSSGKPDFVCTRGFTEAEWDRPYKMWKLLSDYDSDLDPGFTPVYSPNLISGFDRYH